MSEEKKKLLEGVKLVYCTLWYDGPLTGHAWYDGKYCLYKASGEVEDEYSLWEMTGQTLLYALASRKLFEDTVGYHCTSIAMADGTIRWPHTKNFDEKFDYFKENPYKTITTSNDEDGKDNSELIYLGEF